MSAAQLLAEVYDLWTTKVSPDPATSRTVLKCLQHAVIENRTRGEKLLSIPSLIKQQRSSSPSTPHIIAPFLTHLPDIPPSDLLRCAANS